MKEMLRTTIKKISIKSKYKKMKKYILINGKKESILLKRSKLSFWIKLIFKIENQRQIKFLNGLL